MQPISLSGRRTMGSAWCLSKILALQELRTGAQSAAVDHRESSRQRGQMVILGAQLSLVSSTHLS
jgi:hypothetical protein